MKIKPNHFLSMRATKEIIKSDSKKYTIRENRERFFFPDEWMAFYDQLRKNQKITFNILINTGARINEARNIKVSDIDLERGNIVLRVTKRVVNNPKKQKEGKRKIRIISISRQFAKFLKKVIYDYKLKEDDVLPMLSTPASNIAMKKSLKEAGIKDWDMFSVHNIRKTLETWLMALDIDSFKIIKHFGHSLAVASKHYVAPDVFSWEDKKAIRKIIGDLYEN